MKGTRQSIDRVRESLRTAYEQLGARRDSGAQSSSGPLGGLQRWLDTLLMADDDDERDLERRMSSHPGVSRSSTVAIISPLAKQGVGKTTVTFLLGNVLSSHLRLRTIAVDGAPRSGSLAALAPADMRCERTLHDLLASAGQIAGIADLRPFVSRLPTGLDLVTQAAGDQSQTRETTPALYSGLIALLSIFYEVVLLDVGADTSNPFTRMALDRADHIVVVTTPEWVNASTALDGLRSFPAERTTVILNKCRPETAAEQEALAPEFRQRRLEHSTTLPLDEGLRFVLHAGDYDLGALERPSRLAIKQLGLVVTQMLV